MILQTSILEIVIGNVRWYSRKSQVGTEMMLRARDETSEGREAKDFEWGLGILTAVYSM